MFGVGSVEVGERGGFLVGGCVGDGRIVGFIVFVVFSRFLTEVRRFF